MTKGLLVLTGGLGGPLGCSAELRLGNNRPWNASKSGNLGQGLLTATRLGDVLGTSEATRQGSLMRRRGSMSSACGLCAHRGRLMACGQIFTALIVAVGFPETHGRELEDINS